MFSGSVLPEKQGKMKKKKLFQKSGIFPMDSPIYRQEFYKQADAYIKSLNSKGGGV